MSAEQAYQNWMDIGNNRYGSLHHDAFIAGYLAGLVVPVPVLTKHCHHRLVSAVGGNIESGYKCLDCGQLFSTVYLESNPGTQLARFADVSIEP